MRDKQSRCICVTRVRGMRGKEITKRVCVSLEVWVVWRVGTLSLRRANVIRIPPVSKESLGQRNSYVSRRLAWNAPGQERHAVLYATSQLKYKTEKSYLLEIYTYLDSFNKNVRYVFRKKKHLISHARS